MQWNGPIGISKSLAKHKSIKIHRNQKPLNKYEIIYLKH